MFTSTRQKLQFNASNCIIKGISDEGGLFIYDKLDKFSFTKSYLNLSYQELSFKILRFFLNDFTDDEINEVINKSYNNKNFKECMVNLKSCDNATFLELFHGPTMAFKDMALTILPNLLRVSKEKQNNKKTTLILTATSGDTGGAALSGFGKAENTKIIVLYPTEGVSDFQEAQMHYYTNENAKVFAVEGNFDDCQNLVKKVFTSDIKLNNLELSSANSINIGRLIPQIIYYFYGYLQMVNKKEIEFAEKINVCVPTGNFGNILACYIAKEMGLYIDKIVCASNENKVLTDFFNTYTYDKNRPFYITNSPAMDILISSNLERLLYIVTNQNEEEVKKMMNDLKETGKFYLKDEYQYKLKDFIATSVNKEDTVKIIKKCYDQYNYLIDPHTAVGYGAYLENIDKLNGKTLIASTASPYKFVETIDEIFKTNKDGFNRIKEINKETNLTIPDILTEIYNNEFNKTVWKKDEMENNLRKLIGELDENC